jgi:hypothetical protein
VGLLVGVPDGRTNRSVVATGDGFCRRIDPVSGKQKGRVQKLQEKYILYYFVMNHFV